MYTAGQKLTILPFILLILVYMKFFLFAGNTEKNREQNWKKATSAHGNGWRSKVVENDEEQEEEQSNAVHVLLQ